ncbi:CU044_5270 family protein [Actinomadura sp. NTSP31]|uniref:CU044_5270 family protein n=1 Tax=Actinomadura sp. NTSP31 TaxID=1735447 RepID=UPI0035BFDB7D
MDELRTVRDAYGEPAPPTMTEIAQARALWEEKTPRRFRLGRPFGIGLGLVAAGAAAAVAIAATGQGASDAPGSPKAPGNIDLGRQAVLAAATKAEQVPIGRYWYTDRVSGQSYIVRSKSGAPYAIAGAATEMFGWQGVKAGMGEMYYDRDLPARPLTAQDAAVWRKDGSPSRFRVWSGDHHATYTTKATKWRSDVQGTGLDPKGGGSFSLGLSARELQDLPTDAAALARRFLDENGTSKHARLLQGLARYRPQVLPNMKIQAVMALLSAPTPPKVRAGLIRALAAQPGVHAIGRVTDPMGRAGVALAADPQPVTDGGQGSYGARFVIVFDERSGALLSMQRELATPGGLYRTQKPGFVIYYDAFRASGWSDGRPKPPAGLPFPAR